MKLLQALVIATLLAPTIVSIPTTTANAECDQAIIAFHEALLAADLQYTQSNAELLAAAAEACEPLPPTDADALLADTQATIRDALAEAAGLTPSALPAHECNATTVPPLEMDAAEIIAITQLTIPTVGPIGPSVRMETEWGPATATYDPRSNLTTYTARGTTGQNGNPAKWGLDASSAGNVAAALPYGTQGYGIIYFHGVPMPAIYLNGYGKAEAGCTDETRGTICWASGETRVFLTTMATMTVVSGFNNC